METLPKLFQILRSGFTGEELRDKRTPFPAYLFRFEVFLATLLDSALDNVTDP